ncbi:MAG TPA: hypothetical protein PLL57_03565, partial [Flavobacteriales bacterium]|nr:hypothetical protein [Flavobacteriales bacterium]
MNLLLADRYWPLATCSWLHRCRPSQKNGQPRPASSQKPGASSALSAHPFNAFMKAPIFFCTSSIFGIRRS